jgi:pyrroline-5-carboxylate reductase
MAKKLKIGLIGCGNMGRAIISACSRGGLTANSEFVVFDKSREQVLAGKKLLKFKIAADMKQLVSSSNVLIIAVKPQDIDEVLSAISLELNGHLVISIAAGITIDYLEKSLGKKAKIIRVMPNMAAMVSSSISAITLGKQAKKNDLAVALKIFSSVGETVVLDEKYMDAFTAICGSGPAYVFYFIEALSKAAEKSGFNDQQAQKFALATAAGAIKLLEITKECPQNLRAKVTSKGGTTFAGISVFENKGLISIVEQAVLAAATRSKELAKK